MPEPVDPLEAVRRVGRALAEGTPEARDALVGVLADDVHLSSARVEHTGADAVVASMDETAAQALAGATWGEPMEDDGVVRLTATLAPGAPVGGFTWVFRFDRDGRISTVGQRMLPPPPLAPTPLVLDDDIAATLAGAMANGTPVVVAYVDPAGQPRMSLRGSVQVLSEQQLALWVRDPEGGILGGLAADEHITFFYRDPATRRSLQLFGRGRVVSDPDVRDRVYEASAAPERRADPERIGAAVVVEVERVDGSGPAGRVRMERSAG